MIDGYTMAVRAQELPLKPSTIASNSRRQKRTRRLILPRVHQPNEKTELARRNLNELRELFLSERLVQKFSRDRVLHHKVYVRYFMRIQCRFRIEFVALQFD